MDDSPYSPPIATYTTAADVDDALTAAKTRFDHAYSPYDPDVLALIRAAETMRAALYGDPNEPDPMPVFVIKAKDQLALATIGAYRELCIQHGLGEQAREVTKAGIEMWAWQKRHTDRVHLPDHEHVPVTD